MSRIATAALACLSLIGGAAQADTVFTANLTNSQENPPVTPTLVTGAPRPVSFGNATLTLNDAQTALSFQGTVFNIDFTGSQSADPNDNLAVAHIHASATSVPGVNGPVVFGFIGSPFNDLTPMDVIVTPFASGVGATFSSIWNAAEGNNTTLTAQLGNILAGLGYLNFHTTQFPGGEIRGQIIPAIPEPETYALMLAGLSALALLTRRQRRRSGTRADAAA